MYTLNLKFLVIFSFILIFIGSCKHQSHNIADSEDNSGMYATSTTISENDFKLIDKIDESSDDQKSLELFQNFVTTHQTDTKNVVLKAEIIKLFDPETHPCPLPLKLKEEILKLKKAKKPWYPKYIDNYLNSLQKKTATYFPSSSVHQLLHEIEFKRGEKIISWTLSNSPTYDNFVVDLFYLKGKGAFFYTLDCSGYFNAALNAEVNLPAIADLKAKAQSALESSHSSFVAGATLVNPIFAAYFNNLNLDNPSRINILKPLVSVTGTLDSDTILIIPGFNAIWASNSGTSSFNGSGEFASNISYAIGSAKASAGGTLSRKSSYQFYNTYIVSFGLPYQQTEPITVGKVKALINLLEKG